MKNQQVNWFIRDTKLFDAGKHIEQIRRPYGFFFQCKLFLWRRLFHSYFPLEIKINKKKLSNLPSEDLRVARPNVVLVIAIYHADNMNHYCLHHLEKENKKMLLWK